MDTRTFYKTGIILGMVTFGLNFFMFPVESIVVGIVSIIMNIRKKKEHRILISMLFTILGLVGSILSIVFMIYVGTTKAGGTDYWLFKLLFPDLIP